MSALLVVFVVALGLVAAMSLAWQIAVRTGATGWINVIWTFGTGIAGAAAALLPIQGTASEPARQWLVALLVLLWSARLGLHIARRTAKHPDDPRYAKMRAEWGGDWSGRLFRLLMIQAAAALALALSVMAAARNPAPGLGWQDLAGVLILIGSVLGEGVADRQLARFSADPANKGKVNDSGLWSWSRHPNYFFEWSAWLAYVLIGLNLSDDYWWWVITLAAPAQMYWLLVHVSGVPPLEDHMLRTRGDAFRAYQARVNAFFPRPPRG